MMDASATASSRRKPTWMKRQSTLDAKKNYVFLINKIGSSLKRCVSESASG